MLVVRCLNSVPSLVQISVILTEIDAPLVLIFNDVTRINFRFRLLVMWTSQHSHGVSSHQICCKDVYPNQLWTLFRNSRWRPPPSWIVCNVNLAHSGVLLVWCSSCVPNLVQISVIVTYAPEIHLMTSRELTSGFDFWSRGHLRMAVMHHPTKFGADIFIQSGVIDIFPKFKMATAAILDCM